MRQYQAGVEPQSCGVELRNYFFAENRPVLTKSERSFYGKTDQSAITQQRKQIVVAAFLAITAGMAAADMGDHVAALESAANGGDPRAQTELAVMYEHAEGVSRDLQKAGALYCQAAKHGYAEAQFKLGWLYANEIGRAHV